MRRLTALLHRYRSDRRAVAAVEFAFSLPVYLLALFGIIESTRLVYTQGALYFAAQEATRYAIVRDGDLTEQELEDYVESKLIGVKQELAIITPKACDDATATRSFTNEIQYPFNTIAPLLPGGSIQLFAQSTGFIPFESAAGSALGCGFATEEGEAEEGEAG